MQTSPRGTLIKHLHLLLNLQLHRIVTLARKRSGQNRACLVLRLSFFLLTPHPKAIVYSQPADTGTGTDVNTQLLYAINHLKVCRASPARMEGYSLTLDRRTTGQCAWMI